MSAALPSPTASVACHPAPWMVTRRHGQVHRREGQASLVRSRWVASPTAQSRQSCVGSAALTWEPCRQGQMWLQTTQPLGVPSSCTVGKQHTHSRAEVQGKRRAKTLPCVYLFMHVFTSLCVPRSDLAPDFAGAQGVWEKHSKSASALMMPWALLSLEAESHRSQSSAHL